MARPKKDGLEYFPLDTDMDQDDKVRLIEAEHGMLGFGILVKLFMKIYKEGYYYEWGEMQQLLFSRSINVDINKVIAVINSCLKWNLFDNNLFEQHGILTSKGIQRRYAKATSRRNNVKVAKEYWLLPQEECLHIVIVDNNKVNVCNNPPSGVVNDCNNPQSKVKESTVKESTEDISSSPPPYDEIVSLYHGLAPSFPRIQKLTEKRKRAIRARWRTDPNLETFKQLFWKAEASDFLSGRNGKWTSCNFDWLISESNMIKVLEGAYDNKGPPQKPQRGGPANGRDFSVLYN